jgi:hypothetical protein
LPAVAEVIRHRQPASVSGTGTGGIGPCRREGAVAVAQQDTDFIVPFHGEVEVAVAVEVSGGQPHRIPARPKAGVVADGRLEGAVAVAQVNADSIVRGAGHRQVEIAVAVEVRSDHLGAEAVQPMSGVSPHVVGDRRAKTEQFPTFEPF